MHRVNMDKADLLNKLKENRLKHQEEYAAAMEGYYVKYEERSREMTQEIEDRLKGKDDLTALRYDLIRPQCHLDDYDLAISMLKSSVDSTIELTSSEFRKYVLDEWDWASEFMLAKSTYGVE